MRWCNLLILILPEKHNRRRLLDFVKRRCEDRYLQIEAKTLLKLYQSHHYPKYISSHLNPIHLENKYYFQCWKLYLVRKDTVLQLHQKLLSPQEILIILLSRVLTLYQDHESYTP